MTDHTIYIGASQVARVAKKLTKTLLANAGDVREVGLIPGSIRSLGGGHGNPLQYSCLENPHGENILGITVHEVTMSQTQLSDYAQHTHMNSYNHVLFLLCCSKPLFLGVTSNGAAQNQKIGSK